jgi:hypothetical protein
LTKSDAYGLCIYLQNKKAYTVGVSSTQCWENNMTSGNGNVSDKLWKEATNKAADDTLKRRDERQKSDQKSDPKSGQK